MTAIDGLFWLGSQRMAADIAGLRKKGMAIAKAEADVFDD